MKTPLILVASDKMTSNKKRDRNENGLIRMGARARENLGLNAEKTVELWPDTDDPKDRIHRSRALEIFEAYSSDLKLLKESNMSDDEFMRVGFVTKTTFKYICGDNRKTKGSIWIADEIEDTIIGADPEFILGNGKDTYEYAANVEGFRHSDQLGSDGPWAELRPDPAIKVEDFVSNIKELLTKHPNTKLIKKFKWVSGCYYDSKRCLESGRTRWPIGGHIHLGTPLGLDRLVSSLEYNNIYRSAAFACLKKILDESVSIPMMKVEGIKKSIARRRDFGGVLDIRMDHNRLEYRTLSGEWLSHPDLAKMVLGVTKAVSHAFFKMLESKDYEKSMVIGNSSSDISISPAVFFERADWKNIPITKEFESTISTDTLTQILQEGNIAFSAKYFEKAKHRLKNLSTYKVYREFIDGFLELIQLPARELADMDRDLKHTWVEGKEFIIH